MPLDLRITNLENKYVDVIDDACTFVLLGVIYGFKIVVVFFSFVN